MERVMLKQIRSKNTDEAIRLPVYVMAINCLQCTKSGKHFYLVHVTDGSDTNSFRMYDSRIMVAKEKFEKHPVCITVKGKDNLRVNNAKTQSHYSKDYQEKTL